MKQEYRIEDGKDPENIIKLLDEKIYAYNSNKINRHDGELFSKIVLDKNGNIIAGIAGWTWAGACEITFLWVSEEQRNNGIGKKLLLAAEDEAKRKDCNIILLRSYSFQAPLFYEKNGYKVESIIENFPNGYRYYILEKVI